MTVFGTMLLVVGTILHVYVVWRVWSVPGVRGVRQPVKLAVALVLWVVFVAARSLGHGAQGTVGVALEQIGLGWLTALFLLATLLVAVDVVTVFGLVLRRVAPQLRLAAACGGVVLTGIAVVQGVRAPVVTPYDVSLPGLPAELDGTVLVAVSDLHLGATLGPGWLAARLAQIEAQHAAAVLLIGDIFEGHGGPDPAVLAEMHGLHAPLGVWAVTGNHEFHGGRGRSDRAMEEAGFGVLGGRWVELRPGLILAGVDDLGGASRRGEAAEAIDRALADRPKGVATILLSHTPVALEAAARDGVGLTLCGHTHGGQIWPFGWIERAVYRVVAGRAEVDGMTVIVCRGTGTWGPRMRLWRRGEILRITLHGRDGAPRG